MKASELIAALRQEVETTGDKEIIIAANKHSYYGAKIVTKDNAIHLALYDKVAE